MRFSLFAIVGFASIAAACNSPGGGTGGSEETGTEDDGGTETTDGDQDGPPAEGMCDEVGEWSSVIEWEGVDPSLPYNEQNDGLFRDGVLGIHAVHLPTRELLLFRGRLDQRVIPFDQLEASTDPAQAFEWYPLTREAGPACGVPDNGEPDDFPLPPDEESNQNPAIDGDVDLFCAGQIHRGQTVLTSGGNIIGQVGTTEESRPTCAFTFDPFDREPITPLPTIYDPETHDPVGDPMNDPEIFTSWSSVQPSNFSRWYPTMATLADNRVVLIGGGANETELLTGDEWEVISGAPPFQSGISMLQYPSVHLLPSGHVFMHGSESADGITNNESRFGFFLDVDANPAASADQDDEDYRGAWVGPRVEPSTPQGPSGGYSVMYEPGKILRASGASNGDIRDSCMAAPDELSEFPNVKSEVVDLSDTEAPFLDFDGMTWTRVGDMNYRRHFHNLVTLADGDVVAIGGVECDNGQSHHFDDDNNQTDFIEEFAQHAAELWNPETQTWCELASQAMPRLYHSTALLMPDGRVLSMAGGRRQAQQTQLNAEIFTPPYLVGQDGNRPLVSFVGGLNYGSAFGMNLDPASPVPWEDIDRITLVSLAATTHGNDMGQRFMTLGTPNVISDDTALVDAPPTPNHMPPGWYMLFAISTDGVPSEAVYVLLE